MSRERFMTLFATDLRHHLTRPLVWVLVVIVAIMSWGLSRGFVQISSGDTTIGGTQAWITSEFAIAFMFPVITTLIYAFFVAVGAGMSVPRDLEVGIGELQHATPLTAREYVWSKFGAVLAAFVIVLIVHLCILMFCNHVLPNPDADEIRGGFLLAAYLRPLVFMALPCVVFFCGVSFMIGETARRPIVVFSFPVIVLSICVFFLFEWSPSWLDPSVNRILMWIEPSGFRWLNETWLKLDRGVDFYNTTAIPYDLPFLLSRLGFAAIALAAVVGSERHFARALRGSASARLTGPRIAEPPAASRPVGAGAPSVRDLGMTTRPPSFLGTVVTVMRAEARNLRSQPGLYIFVPLLLLQTISNMTFQTGAFDTPILLTSGLAATMAMNTLSFWVCVLMMFYIVESTMRERNTKLLPIAYSTPVSTPAFLLGKALANGIVALVVLLTALVGAIIVMLVQGQVAPTLRPFAIVWGLLLFPTFLAWSAYVLALFAVTGSRYGTYGLALATIAFTGWKQLRGEVDWLGNWTLWGSVGWTDFGSVDPNAFALALNRLFYLGITVVLIAVTTRVFPRREHDPSRTVDRLGAPRFFRAAMRLSPFAIPAAVVGTFLAFQLARGPQSEAAENRAKEYWGRNVATWLNGKSPHITSADVHATFDPASSAFEVDGTYGLTNPHDEPLSHVPMSVGAHFGDVTWTLDGAPAEPEDRSKLFVFELEPALANGDTIRIGFAYEARFPPGITRNGGGMGEFVLPSGIVLTSFGSTFVPVPYFEDGRGVDEDNHYDPRDYDDDFYEGVTLPGFGGGSRYPVRTVITGPIDYVFHGVGEKTSDVIDGDLRTVTFETEYPVNFFNVVGNRHWARHEGDGTEVYYLPTHDYNIQEIGDALDAARRYYSEWFHPFPWKTLRLSEFPALANYAQGFATNITFSENIGFLTRSREDARAAFTVTAHEAAHQWWGNLLLPGDGPGGNVLSEGMAHFSTALLVEQVHGLEGRVGFLSRIEESYGDNRRIDSEKPLVWVDGSKGGDTTVTYDKGGWVFLMLHELIGREAGFAGLRAFIDHYSRDPDHPVLQDFVRHMRAYAPDAAAYDAFVDQWFFQVVVPEFRLEVEDVSEAPEDRWSVTATIENVGTGIVEPEIALTRGARFREDGTAGEGPEEDDTGDGPERFEEVRTTVRLAAGDRETFTIVSGFEPERIVVDPDCRVLQLRRDDAAAEL